MNLDRRTFTLTGAAAAAVTTFSVGLGNSAAEDKKKAFNVTKTKEEWREVLSPEEFYVLREHGTERAFSSPLDKNYKDGIYHCAGCGQPVFKSDTKFDSGTGWPSFWTPIEGAIGTSRDRSFFMVRTEVHCSNCGGHLGHVFDDGPKPTGKRYCMNGIAMNFEPASSEKSES